VVAKVRDKLDAMNLSSTRTGFCFGVAAIATPYACMPTAFISAQTPRAALTDDTPEFKSNDRAAGA
jgi:hypothetical protein